MEGKDLGGASAPAIDHYREAERLLAKTRTLKVYEYPQAMTVWASLAQAHAALALVQVAADQQRWEDDGGAP